MIPILYKQDEKEFKSEGIGHLTDAIECAVSEERNGLFELNMTYPVKGIHFDDLKVGNIILARPNWAQDPQPFDIKTVTPSTDGMTAKIYAQNWGYRLSGIPVKPFTATGIVNALNGLVSNAMIAPGFSVWTDIDNTTTKFTVSHPQSFRACLGGTDGSILQTFSGSGSLEYMWDGSTVKVYRHRGQDNGVSIRYGKNLSSLKQETSIENTYTGCLAYWIDSETGKYVCSAIQYTDNHASFAHERIYMLDVSSDFNETEPTVDQLNAKASAYIVDNDIGTPNVNLEVSFVDLSQTAEYQNIAPLERVNLCDTVHVYFPDFGVDAKAKVIKTEWNVLMDRYNSVTLGDAKSNFSDTIKQEAHDAVDPVIDTTKSFLEQAIEKASELLKGGTSGHMVIGTNANGEANELFFMDTDNKATAKNVFRLNMNGWGLSTTGIDGPYTTACTIDGNFNASIINSGEINGLLIKGGTIAAGALDDDLSGKLSVAQTTATSAANAAANAIIGRTVEYLQTASTVAPSQSDSGWNHNLPAYETGKYIWERVKYVANDGTVKYSDPVCDTAGVQVDISTIKQTFYADSTGAHVKSGSGGETVVQGDGVHIKVNGSEVAKYTATGGEITQMKVDNYLYVGAHRVEKCTMFGETGTGFFWNG